MNTNSTTTTHSSYKLSTPHPSSNLATPHHSTTAKESQISLPSTTQSTTQSTARLTTPIISANLLRCKIATHPNHYRNAIIIENIKKPLPLKSTILFEELPHTTITINKITSIKGEYILLRAHQQNDMEITLIIKQIHLQTTILQKLKFFIYRHTTRNPTILKIKPVTEEYITGYGYIIKPDSSITPNIQ